MVHFNYPCKWGQTYHQAEVKTRIIRNRFLFSGLTQLWNLLRLRNRSEFWRDRCSANDFASSKINVECRNSLQSNSSSPTNGFNSSANSSTLKSSPIWSVSRNDWWTDFMSELKIKHWWRRLRRKTNSKSISFHRIPFGLIKYFVSWSNTDHRDHDLYDADG